MYSNSQNAECPECSKYQDQVYILQNKLAQVHAKLIDQIDLCRQKEMQIIEMNNHLLSSQRENRLMRERQDCEIKNKPKQNTFMYDSMESQIVKNNQILQADLEAMRQRIISQITQKNNLILEIGELKRMQKKQLALQIKKFDGLQIIYSKLKLEKDHSSKQKASKSKPKSNKVNTGKLEDKLKDIELKYEKQREKCIRLASQKRQLMKKIGQLEQLNKKSYSGLDNAQQDNHFNEIRILKQQTNKLNKSIQIKQQAYSGLNQYTLYHQDENKYCNGAQSKNCPSYAKNYY